jgi:hypothetical protein|tara:strand:+ start:431 stop:643 length:213 start_codon:yes stop_codon:yes gene_type:complete
MSAEKIIYDKQDLAAVTTPIIRKIKFSGRVDINDLLARARKEKEKETKTNLVFFGLLVCLVLIVGILLSF